MAQSQGAAKATSPRRERTNRTGMVHLKGSLDAEPVSITVEDLTRNVTVVKIAQVVSAFGSKTAAANHLGVSRGQPGKWLSGSEAPSPEVARRVQDFDYIWDRLTSERTDEAAREWLHSPNGFLADRTPLEWLQRHGPADVIGAIDAEAAGAYV